MTFRLGYAVGAAAVFAIEVLIAVFAHDAIVRPYVGDALAVVLVYLGLRSVLRVRAATATAIALAIAFAIEIGQYCHLVDRLGLADTRWAALVLGTGYDPRDFIAYTAGALLVLVVEGLRNRTP